MAKWYEEAVFYHMYPIGMTGAPRVNKEEGVVHRFEELEKWLPHLADIKATAIYIGPLFESTTHGYDTKDYKSVDQRLGDNGDFARFVEKAHAMGIKVVVDGVFNHTGREFLPSGIFNRTGKVPLLRMV
ncbi:MAG: alpha-amylase family glycosyl hydrolase [Blautia marasmi]